MLLTGLGQWPSFLNTISRDGTPGVWKLGSDGIVHRAVVTVAGVEGNELRITGGLAPGDLVVAAGTNLLHEGEKVKLTP